MKHDQSEKEDESGLKIGLPEVHDDGFQGCIERKPDPGPCE